jgi:hypothetical protein
VTLVLVVVVVLVLVLVRDVVVDVQNMQK